MVEVETEQMTETDEEIECRLATWNAERTAELDQYEREWDAFVTMVRRRNQRVARLTTNKKTT